MNLQDHYDWVVLGDHPGALLSASLIARQGYSVILIPMVASQLTSVSKKGQSVDPEPNFILGLGKVDRSNGLLSECLTHLGVLTSTSKLIRRGEEALPQVLTSQVRLGLSEKDERFQSELSRELGKEADQKLGLIEAMALVEPLSLSFWRHYPLKLSKELSGEKKNRFAGLETPKGTLEYLREFLSHQTYGAKGSSRNWLSAKGQLSHLVQKTEMSELSELGKGLWTGMTSSMASEDPKLLDLVHLITMARTAASFKGGMTAYRKFLVSLARHHGAVVPPDTQCRRIFVEGGQLKGFQIAGRGRMISVEGGILGSSIEQAAELMVYSGRRSRKRLRKPPVPQAWRFTVSLVLHRDAIPPACRSRFLWSEEGAPPLEVEIAAEGDYFLENREHRLVFLRTWLPYSQESLGVRYQQTLANRMYTQLTELLPFADQHLVQAYPDFRKRPEEAQKEFSEVYGFVSVEMIPENLRSISGRGVGALSGVDGLYVATGESYPDLGTFGGTVASIEASTRFIEVKNKLSGEMIRKQVWSFLES